MNNVGPLWVAAPAGHTIWVGRRGLGPSVHEVVLSLVQQKGETTFREIMDSLRRAGNASKSESVSSVLSRMVAQGIIGKGPRRSSYVRVISPRDEWNAKETLR